jgi:hypothetical protein
MPGNKGRNTELRKKERKKEKKKGKKETRKKERPNKMRNKVEILHSVFIYEMISRLVIWFKMYYAIFLCTSN